MAYEWIRPDLLYHDYLAWLDEASIIKIKDLATGDVYSKLAPKRGNIAYVAKKKKVLSDLEAGLSKLSFDTRIRGSNRDQLRDCLMFLVTFTYDSKKYSIQDAWSHTSKDISKAKTLMKRAMEKRLNGYTRDTYRRRTKKGEKLPEWNPVSIRSITAKESNKAGYPAPHMILVVDRPIRCFRHRGKNGISYRIQSKTFLEELRRYWTKNHGFCDIKAICNNKVGAYTPVAYAMKYVTKSIDVKSCEITIGVMTHAWQKCFNYRPIHISSSFKSITNPLMNEKERWNPRLDTIMSESQLRRGVKPRKMVFDRVDYCRLTDFDRIMIGDPPPIYRLGGLVSAEA